MAQRRPQSYRLSFPLNSDQVEGMDSMFGTLFNSINGIQTQLDEAPTALSTTGPSILSDNTGIKDLFTHFVDANNSGTVETDLYTDSLPAALLAADGDSVHVDYGGIISGGAGSTQNLKFYVGGTLVLATGANAYGATFQWTGHLLIVRSSSSTVRVIVDNLVGAATQTTYTLVTGLDLSTSIIVKCTGTAAGGSGGSNQITAKEAKGYAIVAAKANITTLNIGDIFYGSAINTVSNLPDVATGNALISGGVNVAPLWGKIGLTTHVSGLLPIANGGTNTSSALSGSSIMVSNGSSIVQGAAGTTTTVLHGNVAGAPSYSAVSLVNDVTGVLPISKTGLTWINVKDQGAVGDNTTDDSTAIQNAITAASTGGTVFFPPATYRIASGITALYDDQFWLMSGATINVDFAGVGVAVGNNTTNVNRLVMRGGTINRKGTLTWTSGDVGLNVLKANSCRFYNQYILGFNKGLQVTSPAPPNASETTSNHFYELEVTDCKNCVYIYGNDGGTADYNRFIGGKITYNGYDPSATGGYAVTMDSHATALEPVTGTMFLGTYFGNSLAANKPGLIFDNGHGNQFVNCHMEAFPSPASTYGAHATSNGALQIIWNSTDDWIRAEDDLACDVGGAGGGVPFYFMGRDGIQFATGLNSNSTYVLAVKQLGTATNPTFIVKDLNGTIGCTINGNGSVRVSSNGLQSSPNIGTRGEIVNSNCFEWGHSNAAGYGNVLGFEHGTGTPYLIFNGEAGTNSNTYKSRGFISSILQSDLAGGFRFGNVGNANADNQTFVLLAKLDTTGNLIQSTINGATWTHGSNSELLTLSTSGTTTDTSGNLLPANSIIESVVARVTTTITTATDWKLGDATIAGRFTAADSTMTSGETQVGLVHIDQVGTSGPRQTSAAKVRVTTTGTPGAGVIRITVFYRQLVAPTS